jgi:hypothetical protein
MRSSRNTDGPYGSRLALRLAGMTVKNYSAFPACIIRQISPSAAR